jgi:alpha-galactosidase
VSEAAVGPPDSIRVQSAPADDWTEPDRAKVKVLTSAAGLGLRIDVAALTEVARVLLRWRKRSAEDVLVLGDAWERSYGELEWRAARAELPLPWTVLMHDRLSGATQALGVEVRGASFAFWTVDADGITLVLDLRSGGAAVVPGDRAVHAATVRSVVGEATPFATQRALARLQCADPGHPRPPIVGGNHCYYAYGRDLDALAVVRDARTIAELAGDHPVRPFGVIDDGWSPGGTTDGRAASGGPWDAGRADTFPDMPGVAAAIRAEGVRPGIWFRPLLRRDAFPVGVRAPRDGALALDPSSPDVLDLVTEDVKRITDWGFELLKHDYSTYDLLGRWGPDMGASPAADGWALANPAVTTAEALVAFYARVREAAGDALVLGCNVVGHLAAGLVHAHRIGDDTSGIDWDRTRRVGVNALAFRLAQHRVFFAVDADLVPSTPRTDWAMNRQFLDLVARSGTVLFVSVDPATRSDTVDADLAAALRLALDGGVPGGVEPLDWLYAPAPQRWRSGSEEVIYSWLEPLGADPFEPGTSPV